MRVRGVPGPVFDPPPPELLRWTRRPSTPPDGRAGAEAYASREKWVTARRAWARKHGQTIAEWWAATEREARAELWLIGMLRYKPDPDEGPGNDPDIW